MARRAEAAQHSATRLTEFTAFTTSRSDSRSNSPAAPIAVVVTMTVSFATAADHRLSGRRETGVDCCFCQASSVDREIWKAAAGEARLSGLEGFRPLTL